MLLLAWLTCVALAGQAADPAAPPKSITVVLDDNYPPYVFRDADDHMQGLLIDSWALWSERTGIPVTMLPMDWSKAQARMLAGQADVIDTIFETEARRPLYDFSAPYAKLDVPIYFHETISGIVNAESLKGFSVGVKEGDACIDVLRRHGVTSLKPYASYSAVAKAAAVGDVRVFCMDQPPAQYLLNQLGIEKQFRHSMPLYSGEFHRAVRKGDLALLQRVEDGFARITPAEREQLKQKWFGADLVPARYVGVARYGAYALLAMLGLATLLAIWNLMLRQRVTARTGELSRALSQLNATLEAIPDLMFEVDIDGRYLDYRAMRGDLLAASAEVFMGKTVRDVLPPQTADAIMAAIRETAVRGSATGTQISLMLPTGEHWFELSMARKPGVDQGSDRFIVLSRDITDRKRAEQALVQSEQSFRHFFEAGLVGMAVSLPDQTCSMINQRLADMLGYDLAELYRIPWSDLTHPDDLVLEMREIERIQAGEAEGFTLDKRYRRKDGSVLYVELAVRCERGENGVVQRYFVIVVDVTQRRLAKEELARHRDQLERLVDERSRELVLARDTAEAASRAKSDFLSRMSHELRTPLNAILGFSQLLELDQALQPRSQRFAHEILGAGQHLLSLINDVLDLAQVESGRIALSAEVLLLHELTQEVMTLMQPLTEQRRVRLQALPFEGLAVRADRTRLKQVLLNLVSNAIKYNTEAGVVELRASACGEGRVRIVVRDTGPGIAPTRVGELFEPFNRLGAEQGDVEGSGIGLSICRQLVMAMGGQIGMDSTPGTGSEFWLELPRALAGDAEPLAAGEAASSVALPLALGHATVLCVEDNEVNQLLIEQVMQRHARLQLLMAGTASQGLALARTRAPDLILLDIHLPDMDGHDLLAVLRADPHTCHIPVVAITANAMPSDAKRAQDAGFDGFLAKPIDLGLFDAMLARLLGPA